MIQLDVEGFEYHVLEGAIETIQKFKPVIAAERFNSSEQQAIMKQINYTLVDVSAMDAIYVHEDRINKTGEEFTQYT
jgi:hypothetical protein